MQDFYLKTTDLNTMWNILLDLNLALVQQDMEGNPMYVPNGIALDIIGTIYKPTGNMITLEGGFQVEEQLPIDGFHANIRGALTEEQVARLPLVNPPATPYRVWA